jgi:hypothetical protein
MSSSINSVVKFLELKTHQSLVFSCFCVETAIVFWRLLIIIIMEGRNGTNNVRWHITSTINFVLELMFIITVECTLEVCCTQTIKELHFN